MSYSKHDFNQLWAALIYELSTYGAWPKQGERGPHGLLEDVPGIDLPRPPINFLLGFRPNAYMKFDPVPRVVCSPDDFCDQFGRIGRSLFKPTPHQLYNPPQNDWQIRIGERRFNTREALRAIFEPFRYPLPLFPDDATRVACNYALAAIMLKRSYPMRVNLLQEDNSTLAMTSNRYLGVVDGHIVDEMGVNLSEQIDFNVSMFNEPRYSIRPHGLKPYSSHARLFEYIHAALPKASARDQFMLMLGWYYLRNDKSEDWRVTKAVVKRKGRTRGMPRPVPGSNLQDAVWAYEEAIGLLERPPVACRELAATLCPRALKRDDAKKLLRLYDGSIELWTSCKWRIEVCKQQIEKLKQQIEEQERENQEEECPA